MERNLSKKILFNGSADNEVIHLKQYEYNYTILNLSGLDKSTDYRYIAVYKKMGDSIVYELPIENYKLTLSTYITNVKGNYDFQIVGFKGDEQVAISSIFKVVVHDGVYNESTSTPTFPQPIESKYQELISLIDEVRHDLETGAFKGEKGDRGERGEKGEKGDSAILNHYHESDDEVNIEFKGGSITLTEDVNYGQSNIDIESQGTTISDRRGTNAVTFGVGQYMQAAAPQVYVETQGEYSQFLYNGHEVATKDDIKTYDSIEEYDGRTEIYNDEFYVETTNEISIGSVEGDPFAYAPITSGIGITPRMVDIYSRDENDLTFIDITPQGATYNGNEIASIVDDEVKDNATWSSQKIADRLNDIELAKFPNVTIFGQPTINQGQISNFNATNYCQFPFVVDFKGQPFTLDFEFTTGNEVSNQHNIFDSLFGLAFAVRNSKFVVAISTNGTSWNIGESIGTHTITTNTTYRVRMSWDLANFTLAYSTDGGETYTTDITKALTEQPFPKQMFIGITSDKSTFFNGIINLNYATLTIANKIVWQGMDDVGLSTRMAVNMSNIDEEGVNRVKNIINDVGYITEEALQPINGEVATLQNQMTTKANEADLEKTKEKLDALWKLNEGQTYDFYPKQESGLNVAPSGAKYFSVEEVYGNSKQDGIPSPQNPQEIKSVERIDIKVTNGETIKQSYSITPPRPLNKIGDYADVCDVEKGVWEYFTKVIIIDGEIKGDIASIKTDSSNRASVYLKLDSTEGAYAYRDALSGTFQIAKSAVTYPAYANMFNYRAFSSGSYRFDFVHDAFINRDTIIQWMKEHPIKIVYTDDIETESINATDLTFLRSLELLSTDDHIIITDQNGEDVSYLVEYIRKLNEV